MPSSFPVVKVAVEWMPPCAVHPTVEPAEGVLSITWKPIGTEAGHVYCCWPCAEGPLGRWQHAVDDSAPGTEPTVELQVLRPAAQIARAA